MLSRILAPIALAAPLFAGCGVLPDATIGAAQGVPNISGTTAIDVPQDYKCGDPITDPNKKYTVTTSGTNDKCTFTFKQDVTALKAKDYDSMVELKGAQLVKAVDIDVNKLAIRDAATDKALTPIDLNGKVFGQTMLTKADLDKKPPFTKTIEGKPIDALKDTIQAKRDLVIPVDVEVVVNLTPMPPAKIGIDYEAQPNLVIGF